MKKFANCFIFILFFVLFLCPGIGYGQPAGDRSNTYEIMMARQKTIDKT